MVIKLMSLNCNVCFKDNFKQKVLCNLSGTTALYWIVTNMPESVSFLLIYQNILICQNTRKSTISEDK